MDQILLNQITNIHNDIHLGTRKSFSGRDRIMYFVDIIPSRLIISAKAREIERHYITKQESNEILDIWRNTLKEKAKFKTKEKRLRAKMLLDKQSKKISRAALPVTLDTDE